MMANGWQNFIAELKRRRVFRVATLYIVAFWPIIQLVDIASPALELSDAIMRYLIIAFVSGFPVALILAWIFDINADGITVTAEDTRTEAPLVGRKSELWVVGVLLVVVAGLFVVQLQQEDLIPGTSTSDKRSIAVLPFKPFSDDAADEHFADGLTEELLNVLAHVKSLRVAARTSSFAYKGVNKDVRIIGEELEVGVILEGSVRRNDIDNTIRVTAQLVDASTGEHYFSRTWDRPFRDVFKIQDEISASVVEELQLTLLGDEKEKIQSRASADPEAMVAYSLGQSELARRTEQSFHDAIRFFDKAIELDPNYIDAFVGKATAHALLVSYGHEEKSAALPLAQAQIEKAFELDPESGNAWATQGLIYMQEDDYDKIKQTLEKAIELSPSHAMAHMWYAGQVTNLEEKLTWYQRAYELDPRSPVIGFNIANIQLSLGNELEAMNMFSRIIEADPGYHSAYLLAANIAQARGRIDEALTQTLKAYKLAPSINYMMNIANYYIELGETDDASEWLDKVSAQGIPGMFASYHSWLTITNHMTANRWDEAKMLLKQKVAEQFTQPDDRKFEDATVAALYLRDFDAVVDTFEKIETDVTVANFNNSNRIGAMLGAAYVYSLRGEDEKSEKQLTTLENLIEEFTAGQSSTGNFVWALRAQIASIRGETRMAIIYLQRAIDEGFRRKVLLDYLPTVDPLREDPSFKTMIASLEGRLQLLQEERAIASRFGSDW